MWTLLISCLFHFFWILYRNNKNRFFKISESLPFLFMNLKWRAKFQISRIRDSDRLNLIHFSWYKYKIRLVTRLRKRKDQALISISKILKFPALLSFDKVCYITVRGVNFIWKKIMIIKIIKAPAPTFP